MKEAGLSYRTYRKMIEQELLEPLGNGLYGLTDNYMDDWYLIQLRNPKGVYALDTALWLHGLSLTVPFEKTIDVPIRSEYLQLLNSTRSETCCDTY